MGSTIGERNKPCQAQSGTLVFLHPQNSEPRLWIYPYGTLVAICSAVIVSSPQLCEFTKGKEYDRGTHM